jgi:PAS domain S-box-containing protein
MVNNILNDADVMKKQSNIIVFITIMGVFISFALFLFVNSLAFEKQEINLAQVTERQLNSIQEKFDNAVKSINAISALFAASNEVSRKEFSTFASIELIDSPNVLALEWIPKVKHSERASFESAAQKDLVTNFTFTEENPQGEMVAASERDIYYPVYFIEPLKGNETLLGFELSTHPQRLRAIQEARDTGVFIASGIVELVQSQQHGAGLLVVKAIYSDGLVPESLAEKRALLKGYSLGVLKLQDLFKTQTLLGDNHPQSTIFVFDNNAAVGQKILYPVMSPYQTLEEAKQAQNGLCQLKPLLLANQEWSLYQCISNNKMDYLGNIEALIVLLCSLILTFVTTRYLIVLQKQRMHSNKLLLELRNNEFYLNEIFNNVDDAIVSTDMSGRISSINHSLIKLFGYTEQELIGQSVELIVHNFTSKNQVAGFSVFSNIDQYQALGKKRVELRAKHKNSKEFPIEISIRQIKYHGRDIVIGMLKDLSMVVEREQAQLEISKNATELRQLIDTANAPIFGIDAAGLVNEWNQRAEQLTGFAKIDVMGKDLVAGFITDDYKASVKGILDKALQGEESANYEFPLFTKTGDRVDVLLNSTSRRDPAGRIVGVVGVGQDITELNKIRKEQESVAHDLTQLIDTANAPIFGIDAAGLVNEWNQRAEQLTGFAKIDVMGKDLVAGFITDDYKASVKGILDKALQGEESANYEFPLYTKTGDRVDVLLNSTSRRDAAGHIVGVVGVGQDITELNKIRKEQESVAHDLTQLIDTANAPIFGIDAAGLVNEWNQRAEQLTGFAKIDVMGKDLVAGFITDDYKASVKEVLDKALQGEESANYEFPLFTKTGDRVDVLLNSTSRRDAAGHIMGVVGVGQDITELNKIRKEQESVAHDLTQLIDTANAPIFGIDAAGLVNEWNQCAEQLTGFAKIDVMGKDLVARFITEDYKASVKGVLDKALQGEESANYEFPLYTKTGDRVDVLLNSTSRRDAAGRILGVVGVGQDITELNKIRKEQESVAHDLTQLIDTANAPIFGIDAAGLVNEWNQRAEQLTGFAKIDVMGKDLVAGFITEDYKASVKEVLDKALQGEESANYEFPLYTKTGDRVDVLLNSTSRRDAAGHIMGVVGVGQDITELNKIRLEQESVANDLTQLIDTANAPIFGIDAAGLVNEWNQRAEQLTGFAKIDVMGKDLVAWFITEDYKASVKGVLDKALQGEESANYEFPLYTKTGDRLDVLLNSTSRRDAYGQIIGVVGVGQDITEAKKSQAQVVQASKLATLGEMATSVAHELNQPLNVIRMAAGNSRRRIKSQKSNKDTEYILEKLVRIEGQTSRAAAIIDHMRMFGRRAEEKSEMVDPREVVSNALGLLGAQLKLAGIQVVTNLPEKCSKVMGHTIQMEQVILNLLANARDAMKDNMSGSRITLSITEKDGMITISSEDTGGGIPEHILSRIFEPFFTTKEMGKGTGLGLSVSYGIILEMGGTIIAENITDGAKFSITLPTTNNIIQKIDLMGI